MVEPRPEQGCVHYLGPQVLPYLCKADMEPNDNHLKIPVISSVAGADFVLSTNKRHGGIVGRQSQLNTWLGLGHAIFEGLPHFVQDLVIIAHG